MRRSFLLLPLLLVAPACEELEGDAAAYFALALTPPGGFAPLATAGRVGEPAAGAVSLRYGRISGDGEEAVNNIGVTADFGTGAGRLGITAGAATCSGCDPIIMLGADWTTPLLRRSMTDASLSLGLTTGVGAGIPTADDADGVAMSGSLGLPLSMIAGSSTGLRVIPYITPAGGGVWPSPGPRTLRYRAPNRRPRRAYSSRAARSSSSPKSGQSVSVKTNSA